MPTPLIQKKAPTFSLPDQEGVLHISSQYAGSYILLYFYPKDMTPGCTIEALQFRSFLKDFQALNVQVLGVSVDPCESHKKFAQRHQLNFPLLADTEHKTVEDYGVWKEKSMFGKKYMGINRESFLISPEGVLIKHYEKVDPKSHPAQVIADVQALS